MPTDLLDGLFRRLVENLAALDPGAVHRPVRVAEIPEHLVPYRTHRAALGFDTHEDYEMTLLRLLAGERGLAEVFPAEVAAALAREAASVNPDTGMFRRFPDATVLLNTDRLGAQTAHAGRQRDDEVPPEDAPESPTAPTAPEDDPRRTTHDAPEEEELDRPPLPFVLDESDDSRPAAQPREITASAPCPYCGGGLPVGRTVLFCPHCGQNIGVVHCSTCGSELDVGWGFCISCGQKVTGLG